MILNHPRVDNVILKNDRKSMKVAIDNGHLDIVKLLISDGRVDSTHDDNYVLNEALSEGYREISDILLLDQKVFFRK